MFSWLANAWRVPELRKRVLFTAMILAIYRFGSWIPAPGVDSQTIKDYFNGRGGTILGLLNVFSGGALSQFALFALGIMIGQPDLVSSARNSVGTLHALCQSRRTTRTRLASKESDSCSCSNPSRSSSRRPTSGAVNF